MRTSHSESQLKPVLRLVVELKDILPRLDLTIGSYRFTVSNLIPELTQIALQTHKQDIVSETPSPAKDKLLYRLSRSDYEKEWGKEYRKPGIGSRVMATVMRYMPKKGPFKAMAFKTPTPATEEMYFKSINTTVDQYRVYLEEMRMNKLVLPNYDLDSGKLTRAAEYPKGQRRKNFSPDEISEGSVFYYQQTDNLSGKAMYRMHILAASPDRLVFETENISTMRYLLVPLLGPGDLQAIYFLDRESSKTNDVWRYYSLLRTGRNASKLITGHEASSINRAVAF